VRHDVRRVGARGTRRLMSAEMTHDVRRIARATTRRTNTRDSSPLAVTNPYPAAGVGADNR
jgi:hypothetical protein